jgi:Universal stress protein family
MDSTTEIDRGPVLLCYDGSDTAKRALERAGHLLGGDEAVVLTVWESLGSAILRNLPSGETEFGREAKGIAEDVVDELDAGVA